MWVRIPTLAIAWSIQSYNGLSLTLISPLRWTGGQTTNTRNFNDLSRLQQQNRRGWRGSRMAVANWGWVRFYFPVCVYAFFANCGPVQWKLYSDLHGNTHEVILTPGDVLFYESSKLLHGRPIRFNGTAYSSIFIHYYPTEGWQDVDHHMEGHFAIPAGWHENILPEDKIATPLVMLGTSFKEPSCAHAWCRTQNTIKWSGPAKEGLITAPNMEEIPFDPKRHDEL